MADLVMGAMGNLIPKLGELLKEEYSLQTGVKERIDSLTKELELAQAALRKVAQVPWDQLDEQVQIWARHVREASYDMEDVLDTFLVRVKGPECAEEKPMKYLKKMTNIFKKSKDRHKISGDVTDIMTHLQEVTKQCHRYKVDDIVARPATTSTIDPRLAAMYTQVNKLVGMDKSSSELISLLQNPRQGDASSMEMKIVSVVGVGGLGKTTLAKVVYDKLKGDFDCAAFVPVGRNPDLKKIFKDILIYLDKQRYVQFCAAALDERQLIDELRKFFLENKKRYLIIIDDIWEVQSWETIKLAMEDANHSGGRIIITTRKLEVATKADKVYKLQALPFDISRELFTRRISGHEGKYVHKQPDKILDKFIRKCRGIPLAIITMANLLAVKQREEWPELYNTIDFGSKDNKESENTMRILSFSYYDLPSHIRTCLLYLSAFPEDSVIDKDSLVWKWVAEGFVQENEGMRLFEIGERYFNDLINRSMIQAVESDDDDSIITGCRVHDMVLDFIHTMSPEENFFTVVDNNKDTLLQSNVRRLANHKRTISHTHHTNHFEMPKLRSFIALQCVIETWAPLSSFTLLRVLAIENCKPCNGRCVEIKDVGHLLHLRFLSLHGTRIRRIPEEIGALRFLQTLDVWVSDISEIPSSSSLLKQLACLRITLTGDALDGVLSVEGLTSLEELSIKVRQLIQSTSRRWLVKDLGCLGELRVLHVNRTFSDEENQRYLVESLRHLHKLERLAIDRDFSCFGELAWQATDLVLPRHLRYLVLYSIKFCNMPSCINPSFLPCLSHLELWMQHMDEQDLKMLGGLRELCFLGLKLESSATISNISEGDVCYFPKLRCCRLMSSMVLFLANKEDKSVSFHIWNGLDGIDIVPSVSDDELQSPRPYASDDDEMQRPLQHSKFLNGLLAVAHYLLAFIQLVLAFLKKQSLPSVWNSDGENKGNDRQAPRFMPNLQFLHVKVPRPRPSKKRVRGRRIEDLRYLNNLGWEYLTSLQEIIVDDLYSWEYEYRDNKVEAVLMRAAQVHPNHPRLRIKR